MTSVKKILVVEDDALLREAYCEIISAEGYNVASAIDGLQGVERLKAFRPDLVLLDILMPHSDGLDFLKKAKIKKNFPETKVVVFSNLSSLDKIDDMLRLGALRHILKSSLSPRELVQVIRETLET
jgi:DNA-binding response OmpR family regulator